MGASLYARTAAVLALTLGAASAHAQIAAGSQLDFSGTADAIDVGPPGIRLTFRPGEVANQRTGMGEVTSHQTSTGAFAATGGQTGTVRELLVGGGPANLPSFLTIGGYTFDIRYLPRGVYGQDECYVYWAPGQRCTPYQSEVGLPLPTDPPSPFNLENHGAGENVEYSVASFRVIGSVYGPDGARSRFVGTISTTFRGLSYQEALYGVENGGLENVVFDGRFVAVSVAPEPSAVALVGAGLLGVAGAAARRRRSR